MSDHKYIGMDVHQASVVCAVHDQAGRCVVRSIIEARAGAVGDFLRGLSGTLHLTFEEGTPAHWLYELTRPLVPEVVVVGLELIQLGFEVCLRRFQ